MFLLWDNTEQKVKNVKVKNVSKYTESKFPTIPTVPEWDGCRKAAVFLRYDKEYHVPIVNARCAVPDEITEYKRWKVYLVGVKDGYRITTNEVEVRQS